MPEVQQAFLDAKYKRSVCEQSGLEVPADLCTYQLSSIKAYHISNTTEVGNLTGDFELVYTKTVNEEVVQFSCKPTFTDLTVSLDANLTRER